MTDTTNNILNQSFSGSVSVGRDLTVGGRVNARGDSTFHRDVYIEGWLNARNIRGAGKGLYETTDKLNEAYPNPQNGWFALVGNTLPADIYLAWGGKWVTTGQQGGEPILELGKLKEISQSLEDEISARVAADEHLQAAIDEEAKARKTGDDELTKALAKEVSDREQAITDEVLSRTQALNEAIASEAAARVKAIGEEALARDLAIKEEATARTDADTSLQDSLNEHVKNLQEVDKTHEDRLLALEQSEWPLKLELNIMPTLTTYTGEEKVAAVIWNLTRKGKALEPTELSIKQDGKLLEAELSSSGTLTTTVNKLGDTQFEIIVSADGLTASQAKSLTMVLPLYFGFDQASDVANLSIKSLDKYDPLTTPAGTYTIENALDGNFLWFCVPDTMNITKVTSGGFAVPMEAAVSGQTELGGYKCYRSSNAIVAGSYKYTLS